MADSTINQFNHSPNHTQVKDENPELAKIK